MTTRVRSRAKINLGLAIGPLRTDGYHGLATIYQTLAIHDFVEVTAGIKIYRSGNRISWQCDRLSVWHTPHVIKRETSDTSFDLNIYPLVLLLRQEQYFRSMGRWFQIIISGHEGAGHV